MWRHRSAGWYNHTHERGSDIHLLEGWEGLHRSPRPCLLATPAWAPLNVCLVRVCPYGCPLIVLYRALMSSTIRPRDLPYCPKDKTHGPRDYSPLLEQAEKWRFLIDSCWAPQCLESFAANLTFRAKSVHLAFLTCISVHSHFKMKKTKTWNGGTN